MANRLFNPDIQYSDSTGVPYSGAQLFFYASGTQTKLNTYSDAALTTPNSNPVVLDSAGRAGPIFLQNLQYKVILAPATDTDPPTSPIWTQDPVYTSDYSTAAQFQSGSGSPNGTVAGNAGSATIKASSYWDYTNQILYICTTTGTASTAVWTAINSSTAAAVIPPPQGRITLTTGTPIMSGDVTAATTVYYTPYTGLLVPIYNGITFIPTSIISELQLTLTSSYVANNIYDLYIFSLSGVLTLGTGPSWSAGTGGSITSGSCARGTGSGGAALTRVQGILTNAASMTMRYGNGTTTTTVAANQGTYVGSMLIDGTNGQVSYLTAYGQSRNVGIWNAYNRSNISVLIGDSTASWTYTSGTPRPSNNSTANSARILAGLAEEWVSSSFTQRISVPLSRTAQIGIGWNSTSAFSGKTGYSFNNLGITGYDTDVPASYNAAPSLGLNTITSLEAEPGGGSAPQITLYGTNAYMQLAVSYRG